MKLRDSYMFRVLLGSLELVEQRVVACVRIGKPRLERTNLYFQEAGLTNPSLRSGLGIPVVVDLRISLKFEIGM